MKISIREERQGDLDAIYKLIRVAFQTANVSDGDEQNFAVSLRRSDAYIPQLALVATVAGLIVGHIMFTRMYITKADGSQIETLLVAPLSVAIEYRGQGVGRSLMNAGFKIARDMGFPVAILCGDPAYYHRLGYVEAFSEGIKHSSDLDNRYVMCCKLTSENIDLSGTICVI